MCSSNHAITPRITLLQSHCLSVLSRNPSGGFPIIWSVWRIWPAGFSPRIRKIRPPAMIRRQGFDAADDPRAELQVRHPVADRIIAARYGRRLPRPATTRPDGHPRCASRPSNGSAGQQRDAAPPILPRRTNLRRNAPRPANHPPQASAGSGSRNGGAGSSSAEEPSPRPAERRTGSRSSCIASVSR